MAAETTTLQQISENLFLFKDTCNVYIVRQGREAVLIDFGSGDVLGELPALGVQSVSDILITHHHRDQGQGLWSAVEAGIRIRVPHMEQELFAEVDAHWQARPIYNNYDVRQDRFSLLRSVPVAGTLRDYSTCRFGSTTFQIVPTPGHTPGSISLIADIDGQRVAFTGDLIAGRGKVWSMAATQWTYNGAEGVAASIPSLIDLRSRQPNVILPSHGHPIAEPGPAIDMLVERFQELLQYRDENPRLFDFLKQPYGQLTPHLLFNQTSEAHSYVLLSDSGKALLIDYGYDFNTGMATGTARDARRPWLYSLPMLKRDYGVTKIDVVVPTHYHDDHVAGFNLLRDVEGTQVWAAENFAPILQNPSRYDVPCLWYDPIPVDRVLPLGQPVRWEEYELTLYAQPGHTLYAVAIAFEVDGKRALAVGDQYGDQTLKWNYVYANRFQLGDYRRSAELYRRINPDVILSGHWAPRWVDAAYLNSLAERGEALDRLHWDLLPLETINLDAEGTAVRIEPYQTVTYAGSSIVFTVETRNPIPHAAQVRVRLVVPPGWTVDHADDESEFNAQETRTVQFRVTIPPNMAVRRARVAADVTVDGTRLGQQAEALVTVTAHPC